MQAAFVLNAYLFAAPSFSGPDWTYLPLSWPSSGAREDRMLIGGESPNPNVALPIEAVRGKWIRFSVEAQDPSSGINISINSYQDKRLIARSIPSVCTGEVEIHCSTVVWVPVEATRVMAVIWAADHAGEVYKPEVSASSGTPATKQPPAVQRLVATVRSNFYRTDEVDWKIIDQAIAAIPQPPSDVDPVAPFAQWVRDQLPGNRHTHVVLAKSLESTGNVASMPTCDELAAEGLPAVVKVPEIGAITGSDPERYASTLSRCLLKWSDAQPWVIDLRGNTGGNMYPMIAGLAPLLPLGVLYAFVDGHGEVTARVSVDAVGVKPGAFSFITPDVGSRQFAPVIVLIGPRCASSCEQVVNALSARPRTLLVGSRTAGYTTANEAYNLDANYSLLLTDGSTLDPCGRRLPDAIEPDIEIDSIDDKSVTDVVRIESVSAWLHEMTLRTREPISTKEREKRCSRPESKSSISAAPSLGLMGMVR